MDQCVYRYALSRVFSMKPSVGRQVAENFENLSELFNLDEGSLLELFNGNHEVVREISNPHLLEMAWQDINWAKSKGVSIFMPDDKSYPLLLKECADAPMVLFYIGSADLNAHYPVSIVGTRLASVYGREVCCQLVSSLASDNVLIISGMAYGIDICAHKAALEYDIPTVGILPCGIDSIYPQTHRDIAKKMVEKGGILSEFPPGSGVRKWHFLKRNRIIAGMARSVVVVESRMRGGAMRTAEYANSYNKEVYAVPGRWYDTNSEGCNYLISSNMANICTLNSIKSSIDEGEWGRINATGYKSLFLFDDDKKEKILLSLKNNSTAGIDSLSSDTGLALAELAPLLLEMELEGRIVSDRWNGYRVVADKLV